MYLFLILPYFCMIEWCIFQLPLNLNVQLVAKETRAVVGFVTKCIWIMFLCFISAGWQNRSIFECVTQCSLCCVLMVRCWDHNHFYMYYVSTDFTWEGFVCVWKFTWEWLLRNTLALHTICLFLSLIILIIFFWCVFVSLPIHIRFWYCGVFRRISANSTVQVACSGRLFKGDSEIAMIWEVQHRVCCKVRGDSGPKLVAAWNRIMPWVGKVHKHLYLREGLSYY